MSDEHQPADAHRPGAAMPDPAAPFPGSPTRWAEPATDYAGRADGTSPWTNTPAASVVVPEVEPVTERIGWLTARRLPY